MKLNLVFSFILYMIYCSWLWRDVHRS